MGKRSKLTTPIGPRESQSREFRLENPRILKEEEQILYQYLFQKNLKLNFAHQTSSHAHVRKKLCLLASSGRQLYCTDTRHYRQNMHHIIRHCTQATSASLGTCRMRVHCLNDRVVQGAQCTRHFTVVGNRRGGGSPDAAAGIIRQSRSQYRAYRWTFTGHAWVVSHVRWTFAPESSLLRVPNLFD